MIHHKFIVCDFNGQSPIVFCGSSNLAAGGEKENGDNLIAIRDARIATLYAVEAIRLFDHYRFRNKQENSSRSDRFFLMILPNGQTNITIKLTYEVLSEPY